MRFYQSLSSACKEQMYVYPIVEEEAVGSECIHAL